MAVAQRIRGLEALRDPLFAKGDGFGDGKPMRQRSTDGCREGVPGAVIVSGVDAFDGKVMELGAVEE